MPLYQRDYEIAGMDFIQAGEASLDIKKTLKEIGADPALIRRVAIASYEAEINVVIHGQGGRLTLEIDETGVIIIVEDQGPGIPDLELAMTEGYSTAGRQAREMGFGAGMGLPNIKKNSDALEIRSAVGQGTRLEIRFFAEWGSNKKG